MWNLAIGLLLPLWSAGILLSVSYAQDAAPKSGETPLEYPTRIVVLRDEAGRPVPDVPVVVRTDVTLTTDGEGRIRVPLDERGNFGLRIVHEGYVASRYFWQQAEGRIEPEAEIAITLPRGTEVGGRVLNEAGEPIADAEIWIHVSERPSGDRAPLGSVYGDLNSHIVQTDADGRWRCNLFPARWAACSLRVSHPDYLLRPYTEMLKPPAAELRAGNWVARLRRGVRLTGIVRDQEDRPVAGAVVACGPKGLYQKDWPVERTDDEGRFELGGAPPGAATILVAAKGMTPDRREIVIRPDSAPLEFRMKPGRKVRVQFVDEQGRPIVIPEVPIWDFDGNHAAIEAGATTKATNVDGVWEWNGAPDEEFTIRNYSDDTITSSHRIVPVQTDFKIVLRTLPRVHLAGTIVDDRSRKPVNGVEVFVRSGGRDVYDKYRVTFGPEGRFDLSAPAPQGTVTVTLRARGYDPRVLGPYAPGDAELELDVTLRRRVGLQIAVTAPDGQRASGAQIALCFGEPHVQFLNGRIDNPRVATRYTADAGGEVVVPEGLPKFTLYALHDSGWATATPEIDTDNLAVQLTPWAVVEGTVLIGRAPAAGAEIVLRYPGQSRPSDAGHFTFVTRADQDGRFRFDRALPGRAELSRAITTAENHPFLCWPTAAELIAGQSTAVQLGGSGRRIRGRFLAPPSGWSSGMQWIAGTFRLIQKRPNSDELDSTRQFPVQLTPDGRFWADDLPAGDYTLLAIPRIAPSTEQCGPGEVVGRGEFAVTVPTLRNGDGSEIDLGVVQVDSAVYPGPGYPVPDLRIDGLDGRPIDLSAFRGKLVYLELTSTDCPAATGARFRADRTYQELAEQRAKLAFVSIYIEADEAEVQEYVGGSRNLWPAAFLSPDQANVRLRQFGFSAVPSNFVIGADGTILARDLRPEVLTPSLQHWLSQMPDEKRE